MICEMPITFYSQAALGGELEVPTLDGKVRYSIPEGTQTGTTCRLQETKAFQSWDTRIAAAINMSLSLWRLLKI